MTTIFELPLEQQGLDFIFSFTLPYQSQSIFVYVPYIAKGIFWAIYIAFFIYGKASK